MSWLLQGYACVLTSINASPNITEPQDTKHYPSKLMYFKMLPQLAVPDKNPCPVLSLGHGIGLNAAKSGIWPQESFSKGKQKGKALQAQMVRGWVCALSFFSYMKIPKADDRGWSQHHQFAKWGYWCKLTGKAWLQNFSPHQQPLKKVTS